MTSYWCERALLPGGVADAVLVEESAGVVTSVSTGVTPAGSAAQLPGLTLPGLANCHSHAFHRALRGRTQRGAGSFWTWREQMYDLAARLDPDRYHRLAAAVFREMAAAGVTSVGEFHYLHHAPDGTPYAAPNAMGEAVVEAARGVGIRICLLDTCYLAAGIGRVPEGVQRRFSDGDGAGWLDRVTALDEALAARGDPGVVVGAAAHSVRAVPPQALEVVGDWAQAAGRPLHLHLSEQVAENDACRAAYGCSPTALLADCGVLGERTTAVHATHLSDDDVAALGASRTTVCLCPTTERDLGDGIGPGGRLAAAGSPLTAGSDSHAVVDLFEELRAVEMHERLATQRRGHWTAAALLAVGTTQGHASLGFADAGRIEVGAPADLVTVDLESPRTGGAEPWLEAVVFAATAADVVQVICAGRLVAHRDDAADLGAELAAAVAAAWTEP